LKSLAQTLQPDPESSLQSFVQFAIERLEFLRDCSGRDAPTVTTARAVSRIAASAENQVRRIEPALRSMEELEPIARNELLATWSRDASRPDIASAARWSLEQLESR